MAKVQGYKILQNMNERTSRVMFVCQDMVLRLIQTDAAAQMQQNYWCSMTQSEAFCLSTRYDGSSVIHFYEFTAYLCQSNAKRIIIIHNV